MLQCCLQNVLQMGPVGPYRYRHLDTSNASLAMWAAAGYNADDVKDFLGVTRKTAESQNIALDLRIQDAYMYRWERVCSCIVTQLLCFCTC